MNPFGATPTAREKGKWPVLGRRLSLRKRAAAALRGRGKLVAALGIFDGVHLGHRAIIRRAVERARAIGGISAVVTFDPHPSKVLHPGKPVALLMSTAHRMRLIGERGVDSILLLKFDRHLSSLAPADFVKHILVDKLRVSEVCVGSDFLFGRDGAGDTALLKEYGASYGFKVNVVPMVKVKGRVVSSTLIRALIVKGRLKEASGMLGRPVAIFGTVIRGARRGKDLGFPTANIDPHHEAIPPGGVYAVRVKLRGKYYGGTLYIGTRPTFGEVEPVVEAHIFNFRKPIYGEEVEIIFLKKLRGGRRFPNRRELIEQIEKDNFAVARILKGASKL